MDRITVRPMSPERRAQLLAAPAPQPEPPTRYAGKTDQEILDLDLDTSLTKEQAREVTAEMFARNLYGN